jgi:hypothetical protein
MSDTASRRAEDENCSSADDSNGEEGHKRATDAEDVDDDGHGKGVLDVSHGEEICAYRLDSVQKMEDTVIDQELRSTSDVGCHNAHRENSSAQVCAFENVHELGFLFSNRMFCFMVSLHRSELSCNLNIRVSALS